MKTHHQVQAQRAHASHYQPALPERLDDAYKLPKKLHEPTVCPKCGAVYHRGRWQWLARPDDAKEVLCSACHRIADDAPAGYIYIDGDFAASHRVELLRMIRQHEQKARAEHPMERIMDVEETLGQTIITTTGVHLARGLGVALSSVYHGSLDLKYSKEDNLLRAYWKR